MSRCSAGSDRQYFSRFNNIAYRKQQLTKAEFVDGGTVGKSLGCALGLMPAALDRILLGIRVQGLAQRRRGAEGLRS